MAGAFCNRRSQGPVGRAQAHLPPGLTAKQNCAAVSLEQVVAVDAAFAALFEQLCHVNLHSRCFAHQLREHCADLLRFCVVNAVLDFGQQAFV